MGMETVNCYCIEKLFFRYNSHYQISDVNFQIKTGEILGIIGPNGCGKTTLIKLLCNLLKAESGTIDLYGKSINKIDGNDLAKSVAYVPQNIEIIFPFTVFEVVLMGRAPYLNGIGFEKENDYTIANKLIEELDIKTIMHKPYNTLSGGEKQRVSIARALCQEPKIILLDEPNAHLDISHQLEIFNFIKKLNNEKKVTVISVSHDLNLASFFFDRILCMKEGKIITSGSPSEVLTKENIRSIFETDVEVDDFYKGKPRITVMPTMQKNAYEKN
jgi:iron complex transport system ATP-binding protein